MAPRHAHALQLQLVTEREVDVPFLLSGIILARVFPGKEAHVEAMQGKIVIDLLSHLKVLQGDARSDDGECILGEGAVDSLHLSERLFDDPAHGATPAGMDSGLGMVPWVVEQNRDTVGCGHADAEVGESGHQRILAFKELLSLFGSSVKNVFGDGKTFDVVNLMRQKQMAVLDVQRPAERLTVRGNGCRVVTAIRIDIQFTVVAFACSAVSCGGESNDIIGQFIIM